ncbi:MAG: hypothetical protein OEV42_16615 [Deltaproteobacteria bacterium]|nr:hypothetical protein [Deltaproteobacteria bacterium]
MSDPACHPDNQHRADKIGHPIGQPGAVRRKCPCREFKGEGHVNGHSLPFHRNREKRTGSISITVKQAGCSSSLFLFTRR